MLLITMLDRVIVSMKLPQLMWKLQTATKNSHLRVFLFYNLLRMIHILRR